MNSQDKDRNIESEPSKKMVTWTVAFYFTALAAMFSLAILLSCATPVAESPAGEDYDFSESKICPHKENWRNPNEHGSYVDNNGTDECTECHGEYLRGGLVGISCYDCHAD